MTVVPPIKSQGIKTKLVEWIADCAHSVNFDRWVEPFMGTGVVAFNLQPKSALMCDSNPHLINFYQTLQAKKITAETVKVFLIEEGRKLLKSDGEYYYEVRKRFNETGNPLDFMFLSRSCFNGMMRFNKKGGYNVPFCKKPNRFAQSLVTKICNQIEAVSYIIDKGDYTFRHQEFRDTLSEIGNNNLIYCDPPYIGRHVDYFDSWTEEEELDLHKMLIASNSRFIMSTWLKNKYRKNDYVVSLWGDCSIVTKEHFYHVGAKESNRNAVYEALLTNFDTPTSQKISSFSFDVNTEDEPVPAEAQIAMAL